MQRKTLVFLDSGVLLNLLASGCTPAVCAEAPFQFAIAEDVLAQPIPLWVPPEDDEAHHDMPSGPTAPPQVANASELVLAGAVTAYSVDGCIATFVNLAVHLSDVQAKTAALAHSCGADLATDDRKMRRTLRDLEWSIALHSTAEIVREWQRAAQRTDEDIRLVVQTIASRAQFRPTDDDPMAGWWRQFLA